MLNRHLSISTLLTVSVLACLPLQAQSSNRVQGLPPLEVPRVDALALEGPDSFIWKAIEPLEAVTHVPSFGAEPSERTEFRLAHDGQNLYFSCWAFTTVPTDIQGMSLERDEVGFGSDTCAIYIDTLNDGENALGFRTTPTGNRTDFHFTGNGNASNSDWNTFWDVAVSSDEHGWYAEFKIPFSSLLFQADDGRVEMGFTALRGLARHNERVTHPAISPEWGNFSFARPTEMRRIVLEGVQQVKPIYVTPYTLAGGGYTHALNGTRTVFDRDSHRVREVGLDVRYGLTSNLTLDVTINTDFAQVEADDQLVNLSRFSLFFPEKRRFFQERAVNFDFALGGNERLFHSRQIGLVAGEPVTIYGGARLVGRVGEWDVGLLNMQTAESELMPSENQGVVRLRRRVLNENSYMGGIITSRRGTDGRYNVVYGTDAILRVVGDDYLTLNWAQSFDGREAAPQSSLSPLDRALVRASWQRRREDGLAYGIDLLRSGQAFEPRMGFLPRRDYLKAAPTIGYGWRPGIESRYLSVGVGLDGSLFRRNDDGNLETAELTPRASLQTKAGNAIEFSFPYLREDLLGPFRLPGGGAVPAGIYEFGGVSLQFRGSQRNRFRPNISLEGGQFYDGHQLAFSLSPSWSPSKHLRVDATYRADRVTFPGRDDGFTAHIGRLRTEVMLSTTLSATTFVQYNSSQDVAVANFRFRYNPREGTDFYFVWNEGVVTDRFGLSPQPPLSTERTILVKYSHTIGIGL